jgi:hypothetical protein
MLLLTSCLLVYICKLIHHYCLYFAAHSPHKDFYQTSTVNSWWWFSKFRSGSRQLATLKLPEPQHSLATCQAVYNHFYKALKRLYMPEQRYNANDRRSITTKVTCAVGIHRPILYLFS